MRFPTFPLSTRVFPSFSAQWPASSGGIRGTSCAGELLTPTGKPFFHILSDNGIAVLFLETVAANPDEAWAFVSKHYSAALDLDALRDLLGNKGDSRLCRPLVKASYEESPKNRLTRSVVVVDAKRNIKSLLHLHMVKEPDSYGQWKIYGVEQE